MSKKNFTKKRITMDNLAVMVAQGFEDTASKFERVATKEDLKLMATKEDLKALATKEGLSDLKKDVDDLKQDVTTIKSEMVTKSYLDDKLADLEGIVVVRQRKEDQKVNLLIELLKRKRVLGKTEVKMLQEIQVFPSFSKSSK